ncbi:DMT family transporter [Paenalcaligenes sp. Me52]|uniref:DMT family transporter n=1 Tax=Paenalcaligenes sp. Me52 TaxID=3392038 RepID=UPI003D267B51
MSTAHPSLLSSKTATPLAGAGTVAWLLLMVVLWGLSWPATKLALDVVPPLWLAALRFGSAAVCLFAVAVVRGVFRLPTRADWPIVASVGLLQMMTFTGLGMIAMTHVDTSRAVLLAYTTPLWGVLASWLLFKHAPTRLQLLALIVGLVGIAAICSPWEMNWQAPGAVMGSAFLLIGAICWAVVILHVKQHSWSASPLALAPWQMLLATVPLAAFAFVLEGAPTVIIFDQRLVELLFFIGPIATSACFVISAEYGRRISTFGMSNFTLGVPIIGIVASVLLLGNTLSTLFVVGLSLVFAAMLLAAVAMRRGHSRQTA